MRRRYFLGGVLTVVLGVFSGSGVAQAAGPSRIVEGWYAHNAVLIMLGAQDRIVATVAKPSLLPWMFRLVPKMSQAEPLEAGHLNAEELLRLSPDLVFVTASGRDAPVLSRSGLHVVEEGFDRFGGLLECVDSTASLLQTPLATQRAQAYRLALLKELSQARTNPQGPRVLHIESFSPLRVDGDQSIIDQWIRSAGGRNAAEGVHGNKQPVSGEQILAWNPDIIIIGANAGDVSQVAGKAVWSKVKAVQEGRVYRNPAGIFPWDRYSPELMLQVNWARQIVEGGRVDEGAMIERIKAFYQQFYGISLRGEDARRMLKGLPPG